MKQKIIKVGNSAAVVIPKEFLDRSKISVGDILEVETDSQMKMLIMKPENSPYQIKITPEFKHWLDDFVKKNDSLLKKLAKTP